MKNATRFFMLIALTLPLVIAGCGDDEPQESQLKNLKNITITPAGNLQPGTELIAVYGGSEKVHYQWQRNGVDVTGENKTNFTPKATGEYTVTVDAGGYLPKTSNPVTVGEPTDMLAPNIWSNGSLAAGEKKWFRFTPPQAETKIYVHIDFGTLSDLRVRVFSNEGALIEEAKNFHGDFTSDVYTITANKTFYVEVSPYLESASGTYKIALSKNAAQPNLPMPATSSTTTLTANTGVNNVSIPGSGEQWFRFTPWFSVTHTIDIGAASFNTVNGMHVNVYTSSGAEISRDTLYYEHSSPLVSLTLDQQYFIRIRPHLSNSVGTFNIRIIDHSDPPIQTVSTLLTNNPPTSGTITSGAAQWYRFTATAATQTIEFTWGTMNDVNIQLYNSSGVKIGDETNLWDTTTSASRTVSAGQVYYLRVWPYYDGTSGNYQIKLY